MRLGLNVERSIDLVDVPDTAPPPPHLDPAVAQALAAVRLEVAVLTERLDRLERPPAAPES